MSSHDINVVYRSCNSEIPGYNIGQFTAIFVMTKPWEVLNTWLLYRHLWIQASLADLDPLMICGPPIILGCRCN